MAKHLPEFGWSPIIIRAGEEHYTETTDPELAGLVPSSVVQIRTGAFPSKLARKFGVGDLGLRAFYPIKKALERAVKVHRPAVIFITGSPYYPLLLTSWIKKTFDIPVVLDFQDPWVSHEGAFRPKLSKGGISHLLATILEPLALRDARFVTSVSDRQNQEMADRYPWLDRTAMASIPIGGDPEDFDALRANPPQSSIVRLEGGRINLSYVGTFLPKAGPLVETLFDALVQLREESPRLAQRLVLNFVGTSNQPDGGGSHLVTPIASSKGVSDLVREVPQRVPFLEALNLLANSDGLMLIGSDEPHYTASKIYPALMSSTPYISLFHEASSAHEILSKSGGGFCHSLSSIGDLPKLVEGMKLDLASFAGKKVSLAPPNPAAYENYTARSVAGQFAHVFGQISKRR